MMQLKTKTIQWNRHPGKQGPRTLRQDPGPGRGPGPRPRPGPGPRTQDPGPRTQDPGPRTQDPGPGPRTQDPGPRTQDPGPKTRTRTQDPGPRIIYDFHNILAVSFIRIPSYNIAYHEQLSIKSKSFKHRTKDCTRPHIIVIGNTSNEHRNQSDFYFWPCVKNEKSGSSGICKCTIKPKQRLEI